MHLHFKIFDRPSQNNKVVNNPQKTMRRKINRIRNNHETFWNDDHKDRRMKNMISHDDNN